MFSYYIESTRFESSEIFKLKMFNVESINFILRSMIFIFFFFAQSTSIDIKSSYFALNWKSRVIRLELVVKLDFFKSKNIIRRRRRKKKCINTFLTQDFQTDPFRAHCLHLAHIAEQERERQWVSFKAQVVSFYQRVTMSRRSCATYFPRCVRVELHRCYLIYIHLLLLVEQYFI